MRFHVGRVPPSADFDPDADGWTRLREPSDSTFLTLATLVGIGAAVALNVWISTVRSASPDHEVITIRPGDLTVTSVAIGALAAVAGLAAILILHELLHLAAHPGNGRSAYSVLGVLPRCLVLYAFYGGEISRGRFLLMVTLPFVVLSLAPAVAFTLSGHAPLWLGLAAVVNALFSGGDLVAALMVVTQLPRGSVLRHNSWDAYWKPSHGEPMPGQY